MYMNIGIHNSYTNYPLLLKPGEVHTIRQYLKNTPLQDLSHALLESDKSSLPCRRASAASVSKKAQLSRPEKAATGCCELLSSSGNQPVLGRSQ